MQPTQDHAANAIIATNDMVVRGEFLRLIDRAEAEFPEERGGQPCRDACKSAARGARRAAWVVDQVLSALKVGNPLLRAVLGLAVGAIYLVVSMVYQLHKAGLRRRRSQRRSGRRLAKLPLNTELLAA